MKWTKEEIKFLEDSYSKLDSNLITKILGRNRKSIVRKAFRLKLYKNRWDKKQTLFLKENYLKMSNKELANKLGKTIGSIKRKMFRMFLIRNQELIKKIISDTSKKYKVSSRLEVREKLRLSKLREKNPFYNKKHSEETKKKMSEARLKRKNKLGYFVSPKAREKISLKLKGRILSEEHKRKLSISKLGEKSPTWKGGISFEPYGLDFDKKLRETIRNRDNFICQECEKTERELKRMLDIHHIDYNKNNNSYFNLISLCRKCHIKTNYNREHWTNYFKMKMFIKELFNPQNILIFNENRRLIGVKKI